MCDVSGTKNENVCQLENTISNTKTSSFAPPRSLHCRYIETFVETIIDKTYAEWKLIVYLTVLLRCRIIHCCDSSKKWVLKLFKKNSFIKSFVGKHYLNVNADSSKYLCKNILFSSWFHINCMKLWRDKKQKNCKYTYFLDCM